MLSTMFPQRSTARLEVDHMSFKPVRRLFDRFAQRRVRMDITCNFFGSQLCEACQRQFGQQFSDVGSDQVCAQQFAILLIADQLDEPARIP